jgi:deferrochelatase/peroxidase EfeB
MADQPGGADRRRFLGGALGIAGAATVGGAAYGVAAAKDNPAPADATLPGERIPFYGKHQAGIVTPAQDRLTFAAFDVTTKDVARLRTMLGAWAAAAAQMSRGEEVGSVRDHPELPPIDTGEAVGLGPSRLTITVGFGPSLFDDRFGLAHRRPAALADLPEFPGDVLHPDRSGGDLCVQACSNDPQIAFHAIRNLARLSRGTALLRWTQLGFGRTSTTSKAQSTPRNLMGFKDGTNNIKSENARDVDDFVWVGDETDQSWMKGGSYLVSRRVRMLIESWDTDSLGDQERIFGRFKESGAPFTGKGEFDKVDLAAKNADQRPVIDPRSHIRLASPDNDGGRKILRRGYSYTDGIDQDTGLLDAGLFFLAYMQDPRTQFVPLQARLATKDDLNEYIRHTGSGLFATPPGLSGPGDWFGKQLFA